jgi:NAD+ kinase
VNASPGRATARAVGSAAVHTHRRPEVTRDVLTTLIECARRLGVQLRFDPEEAEKHGLAPDGSGPGEPGAAGAEPPDICIVLGGDGTTLRSLRAYAGTGVPVFSVNCGRIGFLATVDRSRATEGFELALGGRFEVMELPSLRLQRPDGEFALNEVSFQRGSHTNVAHLSYSLAGEEVVRAPCDGLIAATPVGSTAYNLSAGGPILAWELRGFVISMVAPHALGARSVVVAPEDRLTVVNEGGEAIDVVVDGMRATEIGPGEQSVVGFSAAAVGLAQLPGFSFYARFREKLRLLTG